MRIWHQSFTDLAALPRYRQTLQQHAAAVMEPGTEVVVHGLKPGTYPDGIAPMAVNSHPYPRLLNGTQICEAAMAAEQAGFDAFALGCFFDPALREARSLVDIPVVSLCETSMLTACSLGRRFAIVALNDFQAQLCEDLALQYGVVGRLAAVVSMTPPVSLFDLETSGEAVKSGFHIACQRALDAGAEVIIPGDGVLNAFLVRHGMMQFEGAVLMDPLGVLFHHAAHFARLRRFTGLTVSRRQFHAKPSGEMLAHVKRCYGVAEASEAMFSGGPDRPGLPR